MRFFHFKGGEGFEFDAHIFAQTDQRAGELFLICLVMNGEDPDAFIWREVSPGELAEPDKSRLAASLELGIEGMAFRHPDRGWVPVPPHDRRADLE